MKGAYLTENILCCTKLSCDNENLTQLDQNEHSGTMKKEWINIIFDKMNDTFS